MINYLDQDGLKLYDTLIKDWAKNNIDTSIIGAKLGGKEAVIENKKIVIPLATTTINGLLSSEHYQILSNYNKDIQNIIEISNGKNKSYVIENSDDFYLVKAYDVSGDYGNDSFIASGRNSAIKLIKSNFIQQLMTLDLKIGDILYNVELNVPDYWVSDIDDTVENDIIYTFNKLETTKVNLEAYYTKSECDNKFLTKTEAINTYAKKSDFNNISNIIDNHKTNIDTLSKSIDDIKNGTTVVSTATKLQTARKISISGDGSGNTTFDGSSDKSISLTLASVGNAGTYSVVTTDNKGRVINGAQMIEVGAKGQTMPSSSLAIGGIFFKEI